MAFMAKIVASAGDGGMTIVHLLRRYCWAASLDGERLPLQAFVALGRASGVSEVGSVALASLFDLAGEVLERPLEPERLCARHLSLDEQAILHLLGTVLSNAQPSIDVSNAIPHGLPGALAWAAVSVRRLCPELVADLTSSPRPSTCPFLSRSNRKVPALVPLP